MAKFNFPWGESLVQSLLEYVFPPQCLSCHAYAPNEIRLCESCEASLSALGADQRFYTLKLKAQKLECYSLFPLTHPVRQAFVGLKYKHHPREAAHLFAKYLELDDSLKNFLGEQPFFAPVPLHPLRLRERGYNQAEVLAKQLQKKCGGHLLKGLKRIRSNLHQASLSRDQRLSNSLDLFGINPSSLEIPGKIVLVDDVITTGATLFSLTGVIQKHWPQVEVVALSMVRSQLAQNLQQDFALEQQIWGHNSY